LTGSAGVDINVSAATGSFGYDIDGGGAATGSVIGNTLVGSSFNDSINGGAAADSLTGNAGNDTIGGGTGVDTINAGAGDDKITDAGSGADVIIYDSGTTIDIQNTGSGVVTLTATKTGATVTATDALANTVNASTSTAALTMDGSAETSEVITYTAGSGNDIIKGGTGADVLTGTSGNDTITGGLAADAITIGTGASQIIFTSGLTVDGINGFTTDDVGAFSLSALETAGATTAGETLDFVTGGAVSVTAGDTIVIQDVVDAGTTLNAATNVLSYTSATAENAAALELLLEAGGGIITTDAGLAENDSFIIQYKDTTNAAYSYAVVSLEIAAVGAGIVLDALNVTDIATTDLATVFAAANFEFVA
jgi:Ca2+-binding RTX toxin-like protein